MPRVRLALLAAVLLPAASLSTAAWATDPATAPAFAAPVQHTLITGDRIVYRTVNGHPTIGVFTQQGAGTGSRFQRVTLPDGRAYAFPASARPYLGHALDPELFRVDPQAAAGPLTVRYQGSAVPTLPGIALTRTGSGVAQGMLTDPARFGAALAGPSAAQVLAGVTSIAPAAAAPAPATPDYPMQTLTVKVTGLDGKPASFGDVILFDLDDARRFTSLGFLDSGETRVSLPLGHYALLSDGNDPVTGAVRVVTADYTVTRTGQTATLDLRKADVPVTTATPRPATVDEVSATLLRTDSPGTHVFGMSYDWMGGGQIFLAPAAAPSRGQLTVSTGFHATGAPLSGKPYAYSLAFAAAGQGISGNQHYTVDPAALAAVDTRYYSDQPATGQDLRFPVSWTSGGGGASHRLTLPQDRTEYYVAPAGDFWLADVMLDDQAQDPAMFSDEGQFHPAGSLGTEEWGRGPLGARDPGIGSVPGTYSCWSCRIGDTLIAGVGISDHDPTHVAFPWATQDGPPVAHARLQRNGTTIADVDNQTGVVVKVPDAKSHYLLTVDIDRSASLPVLSTGSHTEIGFTSAAGSGVTAPPAWCYPSTCQIPALLQSSLSMPTDLAGRIPLGTTSATLTIGHIAGAGNPPITAATLEERTGGGTWTTVPLTKLTNGRYGFTLAETTAQAGQAFDLRVTATDADGGTYLQTLSAAFAVAGS